MAVDFWMATVTQGKHILLLSPLQPCTGNAATILRIKNELEKNGVMCDVLDATQVSDHHEFAGYHGNKKFDLIIAVHAYKSGRLLTDTAIPFILILGGTDVNELCEEEDKMLVMSQAVSKSKHIVAFSMSVMETFKSCWPHYDTSNVSIIPQGVSVNPSLNFKLTTYLLEHGKFGRSKLSGNQNGYHSNHINGEGELDLSDVKIFSIVGGIRSVKNPTYIIKTFSDWRQRTGTTNCLLLLLGSNHGDEFYKHFLKQIERCPGVIYIPGLSSEDTHAVIRDSFVLVNTSDSEGMSLAILEAMALGTLVIARGIPGNMAIVEDDKTGIIFDSPEEFLQKVEHIFTNPDKVNKITENARQYISSNHCKDKEESSYIRILEALC